MTIENTTIKKLNSNYIVNDTEEEITVVVPAELAEKIDNKVKFDTEEDIVLVLATIEKARVLSSTKKVILRRIPEKTLIEGLVILLNRIDADKLCRAFEDMKYHEIRNVIEADYILEEMNKYL